MTHASPAADRTDEESKPAGGVSVRVVFNAIRHHPVVFVVVLLFTAAVGAGIWFFLPLPKKTAAMVFQVSSQSQSLIPGADSRGDFAAYKQTQMALIKSRRTLNAALKTPGVNNLAIVQNAEPDPLTWLDKQLTIDARTGSEHIRVTLEGDDEQGLLTLLGAIEKAYQAAAYDRENGLRISRQKDLEKSLSEAEAELKRYHDRIEEIATTIGGKDRTAFSPGDKLRQDAFLKAAEERAAAVEEFELIEANLAAAKSNLDAMRNAPRRAAMMAVGGTAWAVALPQGGVSPSEGAALLAMIDEALRQDQQLHELDEAIESARRSVSKIEDVLLPGATNPALVKAREELKSAEQHRDKYKLEMQARLVTHLKEKTIQSQEQALAKIQADYDRSKRRKDRLETKVDIAEKQINKANLYKLELENLQNSIAQKDKYRAWMADELEKMKVELRTPSRVTLAEEPYLVMGIEGNRRLKYTLMGALGAFLLGFGGLVAWEYRSRRVTRTEEVSTQMGMRLIGTIPPIDSNAEGTAPTDAHSPLVEAIDTTRIMLTHGAPDAAKLRVLMVTSAVSGEGKTTLSGNLAISLTRAGFRTLLIDGDMQAPSAHVLFDLPDSPGLSELLRGEADLTRAIRKSPIPGLSILPAGRWNISTRQSLVGDRWRLLKRELELLFDFVVIDTSPLLLVSDAMLLAREADGVVLSVLLGVSQIARVAETVSRLQAIGAELAGVVVNNVQSEIYHRYMSRSKYAVTCGVTNTPIVSEVAAPEFASEEPIAEEIAAEVGSETKEA